MTRAMSILTAFFVVLVLQHCEAYKCYICKWAPNNNNNRTDQCTERNFNEVAVNVFDGCVHGCEKVTVLNIDGSIYNFYRNCLMKGKEIPAQCVDEVLGGRKARSCRCAADYCNETTHVHCSWITWTAALITAAAAAGRQYTVAA